MKLEDYVSKEELRSLLSSLVVFIGAVAIFGLFGFIVVPGLRNANKPAVSTPVKGVAGETGWLDPVEYPPRKAREIPPLDPAEVLEPTQELLAQGETLYERNCTQCHGPEGRGDGPAAGSLDPPPRNFGDPEGWKLGSSRPAIFKTLSEGIEGTSMAAFDTLTPKKRMALVHYVRTLSDNLTKLPEDSPELESLEKELSREGQTIPNRVPVSFAMKKLIEEEQPARALELPAPEDESEGARVLREAVRCPDRVTRVLTDADGWREDPQVLARIASAGAPSNGFAIEAVTFGPDRWKALQVELIKKLGQ